MTGTGNFEVAGGKIIAPDGTRFVPVGVNLSGPWMNRDDGTASMVTPVVEGWGFNLVRVNTCTLGGCDCCVEGAVTAANDLDRIVARYTDRRVVVVVDYHQIRAGTVLTEPDYARIETFWQTTAGRYATNPYVWFGVVDEPETGTGAPSRWLTAHRRAVAMIRAQGAPNLIVCCDTWSGQGSGAWWDVNPVVAGYSGVLDHGADLDDVRLIYDLHAYDVWGFPSTEAGDFRFTDDERDAKLRDYITRAQTGGRAVVALSCGFYEWEKPDVGWSYHCQIAGPCPPTGSAQRLAVESLLRVSREFGTGVAAWSGYPLTTDWPSAPNADLSNVTTFGLMLLDQAGWVADTYPPGTVDSGNVPPLVAVTAPHAGQTFTAGETMVLSAEASDPAGAVLRVEWFADDAKVAELTAAPWTSTWPAVTAGQHSITAVATDNEAAVTVSAPVVVVVATPGGNQPPSVTLTSPASGTGITSGTATTVKAVAADPDGSVAKVEFYDGSTKLGEDTSGTASFRARAVTATPTTATVAVSATAPVGADRLLFAWAPTAGGTGGSHYQAVATPTAYTITGLTASTQYTVTVSAGSGGSPADPASAVSFTVTTPATGTGATVAAATGAPFEFTYPWASVPAGTHQLSAVATDNGGATSTSPAAYLTATPGSGTDDAVTPAETGPRYTFTRTVASQDDLDAAGLPGSWNAGLGLWILSTTPPALNRLRILGGIYYTAPGALQINDCEITQTTTTDAVIWLAAGAGEPKLSHCRLGRSVASGQPGAASITTISAPSNGWVEYCDISGNASGVALDGTGHRVTRNWVHDLDVTTTDYGPTVNVGVSVDSGAYTVDGNFIDETYAAGFTFAGIQATGGSVTITENRVRGFAYRIIGDASARLSVTDNVLDTSGGGSGPVFISNGAALVAWTGNRDQNGSVITP